MNNTNNALETLVQRDKQIKKTNDKLKASINELNAELETTTNAISTHASNTDIHTSKEELIQLIIDHLESLDLGITKEVVSVLPTENISDNTLYFVPNDKGSRDEYFYINDKWELIGSTETNFTDYYTKQETDTLLEGKANSVHNHVVSDITDFPTIPTKTSQLINDSGFLTSSSGIITSVSWSDIKDKPNFSTVATSGSYTDLSNTPTIPTKLSQLENDMGFGTGGGSGDTSDCVHKTGNETIAGIKTFTDKTISNNELHYVDTKYDWTDKSLNVWCGAGHVAWFDKTGNRRMHELVGAQSGVWRKACYINENQYFSVDSNKNISYWGTISFNGNIYAYNNFFHKNNNMDSTTLPSKTLFSNYIFKDKNEKTLSYIQYCHSYDGVHSLGCFIEGSENKLYGVIIDSAKAFYPFGDNAYSLGKSNKRWANVYATTFNGNLVGNCSGSSSSCTGNSATATSANSATYATTQATTDNSTKIATTAWVRTYVDSVAGTNTVGSSVSAYWSNSSNVTATGQSSSGGYYPECYSEYVSKTPVVGTIYSGAQLYTVLNTYASATGSLNNNSIYVTNNKAQATLSNPLSSTAKYLCTTANTFSFRAYTAKGNTSSVGASSVVNATLTKSIFIRIE